jgi:hypothetical protein
VDHHAGDGRQRRRERSPLLEDDPEIVISGVVSQPLCNESERTRPGWRAARWMPTAAPSDMPATCARSISIASRNAATWSA